jgi:hypothetical protein
MAAELANPPSGNYFKSAICTQDGIELYDVLCYDDLILGKPISERNKYPPPQKQPKTRKEQHVLMQHSAGAVPQTLWQGEIINFEEGFNLEIFPHPAIPGDYLIFAHPGSNKSGSMCYWLTNQDAAPTKCIEINSAKTDLVGLKYINSHEGRFVGVFKENPKQTYYNNRHHVLISEITIKSHGTRNQIIFNGKQIKFTLEHTQLLRDPEQQHPPPGVYGVSQPCVVNRFCSYKHDNLLIFKCCDGAEYNYNLDTRVISKVKQYHFNYLMPNGAELDGWEGDIPHAPLEFIRIFAIPNSNDLFIQEQLFYKMYLYKESENLFYPINYDGPDFNEEIIGFVKFCSADILTICTDLHIYIMELDKEQHKLSFISRLCNAEHINSVVVSDTSAVIMRDTVYEPIKMTSDTPLNPTPFADQHIKKVSNVLTGISPGMANLVGKWSVARNTTSLGK